MTVSAIVANESFKTQENDEQNMVPVLYSTYHLTVHNFKHIKIILEKWTHFVFSLADDEGNMSIPYDTGTYLIYLHTVRYR